MVETEPPVRSNYSGFLTNLTGHGTAVVNFSHFLCDVSNSPSQVGRSQHFDLITVAKYPPGYLTEAVNAEIKCCRTVGVSGHFLCPVPENFGYITGDLRGKSQADVVYSALRYHRPGAADVIGKVEVIAAFEFFIEQLCVFDTVELECADASVYRRMSHDVPSPLVVE